jgi:hypothetical protein
MSTGCGLIVSLALDHLRIITPREDFTMFVPKPGGVDGTKVNENRSLYDKTFV